MKRNFTGGCLLALMLVSGSGVARAQDDLRPVPPFQIFDNLYYVGLESVSAFVLRTSDGLVLIDSLHPESTGHILGALEELGLDPMEIRYVIVTHAHIDHAGSAGEIQRLTGARVGMAEGDWDAYAEGGYISSRGEPRVFRPMERDLVIEDGDRLTLGDTSIELYTTPGHTSGVVSMGFAVKDGEESYNAFVFGGLGLNTVNGVEETEQYIDSVRRVLAMPDLEVNLTNHPGGGRLLERRDQLASRRPGEPHPFVDPAAFRQYLETLLNNAERQLEREQDAAGL